MTEEDKKLLAFFAANASADDFGRFQEYKSDFEQVSYGRVKYSREELKLRYAKAMLEKYKEFCSL